MPALQREYAHRKYGWIMASWFGAKKTPQSGAKARFHSIFPETQCGG